jgi:hypothetical protein
MAFLIPILAFRIRLVFLHWLAGLRVITVAVRPLLPAFWYRAG